MAHGKNFGRNDQPRRFDRGAPNKGPRGNFRPTGEPIHLGTLSHRCGSLLVLKLDHSAVPYPGAPVLADGRAIGRVDEIFGRLDAAFVAVKPDDEAVAAAEALQAGARLSAYREKFIPKERLLPREQVERMKEEGARPAKPRAFNSADKPWNQKGNARGRGGDFRKADGREWKSGGNRNGGRPDNGNYQGKPRRDPPVYSIQPKRFQNDRSGQPGNRKSQ